MHKKVGMHVLLLRGITPLIQADLAKKVLRGAWGLNTTEYTVSDSSDAPVWLCRIHDRKG